MKQDKKINDPVILYASIERKQHDSLRELSFKNHRSIADITRDAIQKYIEVEKKANKRTPKD